MKIIDLLNKIANGEEAPEKIRFLPYDTNNEYAGIYIKKGSNYLKEKWTNVWLFEKDVLDILNDEVEIIEEKKIEKIVQENLVIGSPNGAKVNFSIADSILLDKINEIIEEINGRN